MRLEKRQTAISNVAGASGVITATATATGSFTGLLTNPSATDIPVDISSAPVTATFSSSPSAALTPSSDSTPTATPTEAKSKDIPIGTVVGVCVGAFVILCAILLFVLWSGKRKPTRARGKSASSPTSPYADVRNAFQNTERRKSARQTWIKMDDNDSVSAEFEKIANSEKGVPGDKIAMRSVSHKMTKSATASMGANVDRSLTMKSHKTDRSFGPSLGLAKTFGADATPQLEFTDHEFGLGRSGIENHISWDGETVGGPDAEGHSSFLSMGIRTNRANTDSGVVVSNIKHTPQATTPLASASPHLHRWEEAEVVTPSLSSASSPFETFAVQQEHHIRSHSQSAEVESSGSTSTKPRFQSNNPFADANAIAYLNNDEDADETATIRQAPKVSIVEPPHVSPFSETDSASNYSYGTAQTSHATNRAISNASTFSDVSIPGLSFDPDFVPTGERGDRAMESLLAALNITRDEVNERLSASGGPSFTSQAQQASISGFSSVNGMLAPRESVRSATSMFSNASTISESATVKQFPLPPGVRESNLRS